MSQFKIQTTSKSDELQESQVEKLKLSKDGISGFLKFYTGQQGEHIVSIVPSLNVSGYGITDKEAFVSLIENLETFFKDLFNLSEVQRRNEFKKMGWVFDQMFIKKLSNSFIDEEGILQNFDFPDKVKKDFLQAA